MPLVLLTVVLGNCAADSNSIMPEFLKQPAAKRELEQPPDVASIIRGSIATTFTTGSNPTGISFSFPVPYRYGGWMTCVRANVTGITGRPMGLQTFLVNIDQDRVYRRERITAAHWCDSEVFQPI